MKSVHTRVCEKFVEIFLMKILCMDFRFLVLKLTLNSIFCELETSRAISKIRINFPSSWVKRLSCDSGQTPKGNFGLQVLPFLSGVSGEPGVCCHSWSYIWQRIKHTLIKNMNILLRLEAYYRA